MTLVIGTAGHIDHGKTTLLRALTGIDADRLPEERARGMTIDLGYAHLTLPDGTDLDFVDVPGHDRLVGNMLVGAGEIDAALLVIAADDGPRAQTREHLELLDALGIDDGLVVVTKADLASQERVAEILGEVRDLLARTTLRDLTVLSVSPATGDGLEALHATLVDLRDRQAARHAADERSAVSRLAIDRVFSIRGRGTVVTGTLRGAPIERGAVLRVVPGPADRTVRVREVQVHGGRVDRTGPGRVALNVAGDGIVGLERGIVLTTDPAVVSSNRLLVALRPVVGLPARLPSGASRDGGLPPDRAPVALHLGTARVGAVVGRSGRDGVDLGGGEGSAILRLDRPIAVGPGDRFVIRRPSPGATLAGGRVLDPEPARGVARRRATPDRLQALARRPAGTEQWRTARLDLHGWLPGLSPALAADVATGIDAALVAAAGKQPGVRMAELVGAGAADLRHRVGSPGQALADGRDGGDRLVAARLDGLIAAGLLARDSDRVRPAGSAVAGPSVALAAAMDRLVAALSVVSPPSLRSAAHEAGCPDEGIRLLEHANRIVRLESDLAWAFPTWSELATCALALAASSPLTPAGYRDAIGTSRKYAMAILEDLDRRAILRRTPAGHVPGPRAPQLATAAATVRPDAMDRPGAVDVPGAKDGPGAEDGPGAVDMSGR